MEKAGAYSHIVVENLRAEGNVLLEKVLGDVGEEAHLGHGKEVVKLLHSDGVLKGERTFRNRTQP